MSINRFTVMSMLQAARAETLGLTHDSALSWGLNRAIFFAVAKRGFKGGRKTTTRRIGEKGEGVGKGTYLLGDELAYTDEKESELYFTIGGKTQTPEEFKRQIQSRFHSEAFFKSAWNEALEIVKQCDDQTLRSGHEFYEEVYKPRRDSLSEKWDNMVS